MVSMQENESAFYTVLMRWWMDWDSGSHLWCMEMDLSYFIIKFAPGPKDLLSDRCILSCPSMDLVTCLLDFRLNFASNRSIVPRLAASLAACAQLSALGAPAHLHTLIGRAEKYQTEFIWERSLNSFPFVPVCMWLCCVCTSGWTPYVGPAEVTQTPDYWIRPVHKH